MTRTSPRWRWLMAVVVVLGVTAAACGSSSSKSDSSSTTNGGGSTKELPAATINGSGSTFVAAYINEAANAFKQVQPNITVVYPPTNSGGSGKGQTDLQANLVDFAGTDVAPARGGRLEVPGWRDVALPDRGRPDHALVQPVGCEQAEARR